MCVFPVYRLAVDAKPERVMMQPAENIWACSRIFNRMQHQWLVRDILQQPQGVFYVFVFLQDQDSSCKPLCAQSHQEKNKNHKNPLKRIGGKAPGDTLPLWTYKSKLLMPKPKASHHPLVEGQHSLQGDKHKKHFVRREQERNIVSVPIWYTEDMCV